MMNDEERAIIELDFSELPSDSNILILGKNDDDIIRMSELIILGLSLESTIISQRNTKTFAVLFPDDKICKTIEEANVEQILADQADAIQRKNCVNKLVYLDVCANTRANARANDKIMDKLMSLNRHYYLSVVTIARSATNFRPHIRTCFDYVFLLPDKDVIRRHNIFTRYASDFQSFDEFKAILDAHAENNGVMVMNNRSNTGNFVKDLRRCGLNSAHTKSARKV